MRSWLNISIIVILGVVIVNYPKKKNNVCSPNAHSNWFCLRFQIVPTLRQFSIDFNSEFAAAVGQLDAVQQQKLAAALA
jgi:hypothetical protein